LKVITKAGEAFERSNKEAIEQRELEGVERYKSAKRAVKRWCMRQERPVSECKNLTADQ
jgi:hypothetical protein